MSIEQEGSEPKKGFKVVDRRRFNDDGSAREGPDVAPEPVRPSPATAPAPAAAAPAPAPSAGGAPKKDEAGKPAAGTKPAAEEAPNGLTFSIFIQSLAQQALMQLGLIPWPHGQRELHLEQARDTIDIIVLLKAKTKGNLSAEENQLLDTIVYELKMSWVEVQQAIARSKGAGVPRPPGR
jgi:hypothetical protein